MFAYAASTAGSATAVALPSSAQGTLFALQVLVEAIKHLAAKDAHDLLQSVVAVLLPQFSSRLTDIRKTVVFALVELHALVGQQRLMPFLMNLTAAQSKLLGIYIDRKAGAKRTEAEGAVALPASAVAVMPLDAI